MHLYTKTIRKIMNERIEKVLAFLEDNGIEYKNHTHPPLPTIELALEYWKEIDSTHCKNLFFRNHKGNRHYLVVFECHKELSIHTLEKSLRQGKLSFASQERMERCLGLLPGSVSPFGLINDTENHVHLFIDENLKKEESLSFHPNDNRATVVVSQQEFMRYLSMVGNSYEFIELY